MELGWWMVVQTCGGGVGGTGAVCAQPSMHWWCSFCSQWVETTRPAQQGSRPAPQAAQTPSCPRQTRAAAHRAVLPCQLHQRVYKADGHLAVQPCKFACHAEERRSVSTAQKRVEAMPCPPQIGAPQGNLGSQAVRLQAALG